MVKQMKEANKKKEEKIKELQVKIDALSETKKLLEKVNDNVLSENRECYRKENK